MTIQPLLAAYPARIENAAAFARRNRVVILKTEDGIGIDISLGAFPFEQLAVERATPFEFEGGVILRTCSAEDLLVFKVFASRPIDIRDAEGIVVRNGKQLNWRYVEEQLTPPGRTQGRPLDPRHASQSPPPESVSLIGCAAWRGRSCIRERP